MVAIGFTERRAVIILYGFSLLSGLIALGLPYVSAGIAVVGLVLYLLFILFFWIYLGRVKVYPEESIFSGDQAGRLTPVLVEITYKRRLFEIALDFLLVTIAYYAAYLLRFEGDLGPDFVRFIRSLPIVIASQILSFYLMGIYRGVWASTGVRDLIDYFKAVTLATVVSMLVLLFLYRFQSISRAVFVIYFGIMLILVSLSRLSFRILEEGIKRGRRSGRRTIIYGAGMGGQIVLKEIEQNSVLGLSLVGFLDDDTHLVKRKVKGYPVLGGYDELNAVIAEHAVEEIIISFRKNGSEKTDAVRREVAKTGLDVKVRQMYLVFK
jgi:UDP-GlcNAc:undecaprenyl-phosphate GlcNAc-1-phosphate transferase